MDTLCKKLLWIAFVLVLSQHVTAQEKVSKKITKSYAMTDSGELHLVNKYGNIKLFGWDKDEVAVDIAITVNHRKLENAEDLLRRISPILQENTDFVAIRYHIKEKKSGFFAKLFEEANPFDFNRSNIQIDYTVYMPAKAELKLTNTFGDVIIEDWNGELKATLGHGDLFINENINRADINMRYGKVRAKNIGYGSIDLYNGELDMEDSKSLRINSSGTDMTLNTITSLELYSNKDNITIDEVGTIYGTLKFTTLQVERLKNTVDLSLKIADLRVSQILAIDADITIDQESSEVSLNISDFSHQFEAVLEEGLVRMPKSFQNIASEMLDKGKKLRQIKASYGDEIQGSISITGKKGVVLLKEL